jgi:hypothetical protein
MVFVVQIRIIQIFSHTMSAPNSSAPGPSTPGGELQQISPGAWPTADGGQVENSARATATPQSNLTPVPSPAKQVGDNSKRSKGNVVPKPQG